MNSKRTPSTRISWKNLSLVGLTLLIISQMSLAQRILLDRVIAIVDEDVVLQSELDNRIYDLSQNAERAGQELPPADEMRTEVLELLIIENIQLQFAVRASIRFDDDTINRIMGNMAQNNNMSFDEYVNILTENGVYFQTREEVRRQMTLQELQRGMVNRRITITEQEIENFLNSEMGREVMAAEYNVNHMLVESSSADSAEIKASKLKYAADLVARLEEGDTFAATYGAATAARLFDVDSTRFGWRKADDYPGIFTELVTNMEVAEVNGPIEAGNGYHIIQLAEKRGGTDQVVSQTNIRHIMLTPNEIRDEDDTEREINSLRARIVAGEDFGDLARQNSDDDSSVVAGGDLDWINEGEMPPIMEQVVDELEIEELSEPYRTDAGWHIAQVMDRQEKDLSEEYSHNQAERALRDRKFDLELQNWLIEIREEAFVELVE